MEKQQIASKKWKNSSEAFDKVVHGIEEIVNDLRYIQAPTARQRQQFIQQLFQRLGTPVAISVITLSLGTLSFKFVSSIMMSPEELFKQGFDAAKREDWPQAIENYTQAIQGDYKKAIYYTKRGNVYYIEKTCRKQSKITMKQFLEIILILKPNSIGVKYSISKATGRQQSWIYSKPHPFTRNKEKKCL